MPPTTDANAVPPSPKETLRRYLAEQRAAVLWKLEGLTERDQRSPRTASGTSLLGLVKHLAATELGYLGGVFGRTPDWQPDWITALDEGTAEPDSDLWARADESPAQLVALYRRVGEHSEQTIDALDLDAEGEVPWWGERSRVTLHQILVHVIAETARHAGHADIVREGIDDARGLAERNDNLPARDADGWAAHRARLQAIADGVR